MSFDDSYKYRRSHLHSMTSGKSDETSSFSQTYVSGNSRPTARTEKETMIIKASGAAKSSTPSAPSASSVAPSSYLARIAGATGSSGSSKVFYGSSNGGVKSQLENRLHWMETAFKTDPATGQPGFNPKAVIGASRRRIMVLLREQMTPQMRKELDAIDKELADLSDHM